MAPASLRDAEAHLLERRRAQRGSHTLGDDADRAFLAALSALAPHAHPDARASGRRLGEHVYSRRFLDDDLPGAVGTLSRAIAESGVGALTVASAFHRSATVLFDAATPLAAAHPLVRRSYVAGVLEGYLASAFNCATEVADEGPALRVRLGDGRDVNALAGRGTA